jgi:hypothetical protein
MNSWVKAFGKSLVATTVIVVWLALWVGIIILLADLIGKGLAFGVMAFLFLVIAFTFAFHVDGDDDEV